MQQSRDGDRNGSGASKRTNGNNDFHRKNMPYKNVKVGPTFS